MVQKQRQQLWKVGLKAIGAVDDDVPDGEEEQVFQFLLGLGDQSEYFLEEEIGVSD
jgi:hypothetical protein